MKLLKILRTGAYIRDCMTGYTHTFNLDHAGRYEARLIKKVKEYAEKSIGEPVKIINEPKPQANMQKIIQFAYPTSDNAKRFKFYKTGCFVVELYDSINPPKPLNAFATKQEAKTFAETLPETWHPLHLKYFKD